MLVAIRSLTKAYGSTTALADCTLDVRPGEVFGLLGPNGSGKTTLLRLLMGFLRPTSGSATIAGLDTYRQAVEVHRQVAYLPGDVRLFSRMRGRTLLDFFVHVRGQRDVRGARQLAERLDLDLSRRVAYMSTGMRQKLALVVTLSVDVPLLILDEPTSNLDPSVRSEIMALVDEARRAGRTVLFSSHVLPEVEETCDRVAILPPGTARGRAGHVPAAPAASHTRRLTRDMPEVPAPLRQQLSITTGAGRRVTIDTPAELAPILGWLASLPLEDISIEPLGLRPIYDQYHRPGPPAGAAGETDHRPATGQQADAADINPSAAEG